MKNKKKMSLQFVDKKEEWVDINSNEKGNKVINIWLYSLEDTVMVKIIWWEHEGQLNFRRKKNEQITNY